MSAQSTFDAIHRVYLAGEPRNAAAMICDQLVDTDSNFVSLLMRALIELDLPDQALTAFNAVPGSMRTGELYYWSGVCRYLLSQNIASIDLDFSRSRELGFSGASLGFAFLHYARSDYGAARRFVSDGLTDSLGTEYQHIQWMIRAQIALADRSFDEAFDHLQSGYLLLRDLNSVLRLAWNDVLYVRALRMSDQFQLARFALERLTRWVNPEQLPRLSRNIAQAVELVLDKDHEHRVDLPTDEELSKIVTDAAIYRKPMLASLFEYLRKKSDGGASKQELAENVWDERYNPMIHDDRIYKAIKRLRSIVGDDLQSPRIVRQTGSAYQLCYKKS